MKILVTGAHGLVGKSLVDFFIEQQHEVFQLVRQKEPNSRQEIVCALDQPITDHTAFEGFDAIVHLAGESIFGYWTKDKKKKIEQSRVLSTKYLSQMIAQLKQPPSTFICASAIGFYGDRGSEILTENSTKGEGFLSDVCLQWEEASRAIDVTRTRVIHTRFGIILSQKGGALKTMLPLFRLGIGGKLGSGQQWMSWISLRDVVKAINFVMTESHVKGVVNFVSPESVTNEHLTKELGRVLNRPTFCSVPEWLIKLCGGEMAESLLLSSQRVIPDKLQALNYVFLDSTLQSALNNLLD